MGQSPLDDSVYAIQTRWKWWHVLVPPPLGSVFYRPAEEAQVTTRGECSTVGHRAEFFIAMLQAVSKQVDGMHIQRVKMEMDLCAQYTRGVRCLMHATGQWHRSLHRHGMRRHRARRGRWRTWRGKFRKWLPRSHTWVATPTRVVHDAHWRGGVPQLWVLRPTDGHE